MTPPHPRSAYAGPARWGLLGISLVTAVGLVVAASISYGDAKEAADTVTHARAVDLYRLVRRTLRMRPREPGLLADIVDDFSEQGLRYIGIVGREGPPLEAGERSGPELTRTPKARGLRFIDLGERLRVIGPLHLRGPMMRRRQHPPGLVAIELEPLLADEMTGGALTLLAVSGAAALLLILGALVFWRLAERAARAEAQLAHDRRLAALGEMSAVLGHELRNPLAALKGHAQLVAERLEPGHRAEGNAARVVREAQRLELLTGQILDFARTGTITRTPTDPREPVDAAIATLGDQPIQVDSGGAPERWPLDGDRMGQVLTNLLKNAAQESAPGQGIEVRVARFGDALRYSVRDHGPGFPPGEAEHLFEPFRTRRVHGTGLGLAIARRIVEAHGGTIVAKNHPEGGALVEITLPPSA